MISASTVLLRTQSDERLVTLVRAGHDRAFEAIVERYRRPLLRACRRILPEARAEDALQQALVGAWMGLRRGDDVEELRPWLYRIVRNTALNQLRLAGYDLDELVDTLGSADGPDEEVARRALVRQTLASVAALPERQRDALLRSAVEGQGQDEIARDLGLTDSAVRQLVHRARTSVRTAATALVPLPVATWLASAGGTAATVTAAKVGAAAVLAGGAVTAPVLVSDHPGAKHAIAERTPQAARAAPAPTARPAVAAATASPAATAVAVAPVTTPVAARRGVARHEDERADRTEEHVRPEEVRREEVRRDDVRREVEEDGDGREGGREPVQPVDVEAEHEPEPDETDVREDHGDDEDDEMSGPETAGHEHDEHDEHDEQDRPETGSGDGSGERPDEHDD